MSSSRKRASSKYRSRVSADKVIAFSMSYQRDNLLARGMGLEHLRDLLIRLARPLLRDAANLAYGGHWKETEDNFTFDLLRLVSAEQEDNSSENESAEKQKIGMLYNHSSWPYYLDITTRIEAQWINCCRIVRVTQQDAGFTDAEIVRNEDAWSKDARTIFNTAVTTSAMRRIMTEGTSIPIAGAASEAVPPVAARILLGGKADSYSGFMPGIFEEALLSLEKGCPVYVLGGFGGAAEILAKAILAEGGDRPAELTLAWQQAHNAELVKLLDGARGLRPPSNFRSTEPLLDALFRFVLAARSNLSETLKTGLSDEDTRDLLTTQSVPDAVRLVRTGLRGRSLLSTLPA